MYTQNAREQSNNARDRLKVLVIGLGQLGLPVAKYVKEQGGFDTYGYDISTKAIDRAQKLAGIKRIGGNDGSDGGSISSSTSSSNNNNAIDFVSSTI